MDTEYLIDQVQQEIRCTPADVELGAIVIHVLMREGVDLLHEPSLEEMKQILTQAGRIDRGRLCVA